MFCVLYFRHSSYSYRLHCVSPCFNEPFNCFICQYLPYERKYGSWIYGGYRASQSTLNLGNSLFRPMLITTGNILCGISWRWRKVTLSKLDLENAFVCNLKLLFFFFTCSLRNTACICAHSAVSPSSQESQYTVLRAHCPWAPHQNRPFSQQPYWWWTWV